MKHNSFWFTLNYIRKNTPGYFVASILYYLIFECDSAVHNIWIYRLLLGILVSGSDLRRLIWVVLGIIIYDIGSCLFFGWFEEMYKPIQENRIDAAVKHDILDRAAETELKYYDVPKYYNEVILTLESSHEKILDTFKLYLQIAGAVISVIISIIVYINIGMTYFVLIFVFTGLSMWISRHIAKKQYHKKKDALVWERKKSYFSNLMISREYAQDIRLTEAFGLFRKQYGDAVASYKKTVRTEGSGLSLLGFIQNYGIEQLILNFCSMAYLAYTAIIIGSLDITGFVAAFNGIRVISQSLSLLFGNYLEKLHENAYFINTFRSFYKGETDYGANSTKCDDQSIRCAETPELTDRCCIEFDNVSFTYPESKRPVIDNLSLSVPEGKRIAIVGRNGAGKSTLVKLLLRLYEPDSGRISIRNLTDCNPSQKERYNSFGILFQQYNLYALPVSVNVAMNNEQDMLRVEEALDECGFNRFEITLPHGMETEVSKEFDKSGLELSGGQRQILASSRIYYGKKTIFILDEPSSAIDPEMESEMIDRLWRLTEGGTSVIISHRLSMTKNSDIIYYLEGGKITEQGTHEELLIKKGSYAAMWNAQAEKYQEENSEIQVK